MLRRLRFWLDMGLYEWRVMWACVALSVGCSVLTACATTPVTVNDYCAIASPILVSRSDVLTDATAKAILAANETGAKLCKWKHK